MAQDFGTPPYQPTPAPYAPPPPPKKNNTTLIIVIVILVVLCCCCVLGGAGWWLWKNGDQFLPSSLQLSTLLI